MNMNTKIEDLLESARQPLNIIEEYAALSPKRKMLLCDQLFIEGKNHFKNTVALLWPEATSYDLRKLESFLVLIKNSRIH